MWRTVAIITVVCVVLLVTCAVYAAPGLLITKPPAMGPENTGPAADPPAAQGQWFLNQQEDEENRTHEFYDNVAEYGGGWDSYRAIEGQIAQIYYNIDAEMVAFDIWVTITNDMRAATPWGDGSNSHGEALQTIDQIEKDMLDVKMTFEFADDGILGNIPGTGPPYISAPPPFDQPVSIESNIYALNYDDLAWYCWTPEGAGSDGQYMVPAWDFGDIPLGESSSRLLQLALHSPVGAAHALYTLLTDLHYANDVLMNRTSSLKISDHSESLAADTGVSYPQGPWVGSNCSVFFNIEEEEPPTAPVLYDVERLSNGDIALMWLGEPQWTYRVEVSVDAYDYDESLMSWTTAAYGLPGNAVVTWTDTSAPVVAGEEKYYRIYAQNGPVETVCPDTAGAMMTYCVTGRNIVSCMFEPYPPGGGTPGLSTLDKILGNQFTGSAVNFFSDIVESWNILTLKYDRAWNDIWGWVDWTTGGPPVFGWDADVGYWINILSFNPPVDFLQYGRVSKADRVMSVAKGRTLLGSCFPVPRSIDKVGLISSGFTGSAVNFFSDTVEFWDTTILKYYRGWYDTSAAEWKDWAANPFGRQFKPGDGIWIMVLSFNSAFIWTYPLPPGYN